MSETKRWLVGLFVTAMIGATGLFMAYRRDARPAAKAEPQQIVVKVDSSDITSQAGGIAEAAMSVQVGPNPTEETKKEAREKARKQAMEDAFKRKVQEIRATKKVDDEVAEQVLASDPESFFAEGKPPVLVKEEVVEGQLHVEYQFHFDEDKLANALAAVKEVKQELKKCDGSLGPDHPQHRVIVLYRDGNGQVVAPATQPAREAVRGTENFVKGKGVQVVDPQTQAVFYEKVRSGAMKLTGPNDFVDLAVEADKMPCFFLFVSVEVTPEPGPENRHQVRVSMSVTCQGVEGNHVGAGTSKPGVQAFTGQPNPASFEQHAAKALNDVMPYAMKELWDLAGPALTGH